MTFADAIGDVLITAKDQGAADAVQVLHQRDEKRASLAPTRNKRGNRIVTWSMGLRTDWACRRFGCRANAKAESVAGRRAKNIVMP